jgi:opacity protein-like surface antigen
MVLPAIAAASAWRARQAISTGISGISTDIAVEHTGSINSVGYGLTLTTLTAGPRFVLLPKSKLHPFTQALLGFAHGSGSQFPQQNTLVSSANSFALDIGAGADYSLNKRISVRILQLDYLSTALPNNTTNWQNNLRIGTGITLHFSH